MPEKASIIDLFAGPGGLGEGFSAFSASDGENPFRIVMSIEKEASAHKTLQLRAFYRQFFGNAPDEYYAYLRGEITRDHLLSASSACRAAAAAALEETLGSPRALGDRKDDQLIHKRLHRLRKQGGPFVVIGGPPCQAYSLVGRARNKGVKGYRAETDHRHFLYSEYLKVLDLIQPEVFVMENVKGILSSKVNGKIIFPDIIRDLSQPTRALGKRGGRGYRIYSLASAPRKRDCRGIGSYYIIRGEDFGIPQARHRVILLGVREDIDTIPDTLQAADAWRTVGDVIADLPPLRSGLSKRADSPELWHRTIEGAVRKVSCEAAGAGLATCELAGLAAEAANHVSRGGRFQPRKRKFRGDRELAEWYLDSRLNGFINHESRGHIEADLARYLFCAVYARQRQGSSPKVKDFPDSLAPRHANWRSGKFVDRFKVQAANWPASTVTSHISKDGHYFIHPDPAQCRSLTVREAARIQTFPDNYLFEGNRTQQFVQVGNAVPPLLARQIADVVYRVIF